jgi:hypothetical protein
LIGGEEKGGWISFSKLKKKIRRAEEEDEMDLRSQK